MWLRDIVKCKFYNFCIIGDRNPLHGAQIFTNLYQCCTIRKQSQTTERNYCNYCLINRQPSKAGYNWNLLWDKQHCGWFFFHHVTEEWLTWFSRVQTTVTFLRFKQQWHFWLTKVCTTVSLMSTIKVWKLCCRHIQEHTHKLENCMEILCPLLHLKNVLPGWKKQFFYK